MPEKEILGPFCVREDYNLSEDVKNNISYFREYMDKQLAIADDITDDTLQLICYFSMIDCMAQETENYPTSSDRGIFCDFVLKHVRAYNYLSEVEPVTLYYRVEDSIEMVPFLEGFPKEKAISLDSLGGFGHQLVKDIMATGKSKEILDYITDKQGALQSQKYAREHRLVELIYRMRSKVTHELNGLGEEGNLRKSHGKVEPYYADVGRIYVEDGNVVSDDVYELIIPNSFVRAILVECIEGYLEECLKNQRLPFSNNDITRKHRLSWYDK